MQCCTKNQRLFSWFCLILLLNMEQCVVLTMVFRCIWHARNNPQLGDSAQNSNTQVASNFLRNLATVPMAAPQVVPVNPPRQVRMQMESFDESQAGRASEPVKQRQIIFHAMSSPAIAAKPAMCLRLPSISSNCGHYCFSISSYIVYFNI